MGDMILIAAVFTAIVLFVVDLYHRAVIREIRNTQGMPGPPGPCGMMGPPGRSFDDEDEDED